MEGSFRFIHCADLHLGCGFANISGYNEELSKKLNDSIYTALDRIVQEAAEQNVDFVVFSGDIFHTSAESPMTRRKFVEAIEKIGVPCYIAYGNHDYKRKWEDFIPLPKNAFVFPDTLGEFVYEKDGVQTARLIGASFSQKHTSADLTEKADGYGDVFTIGVFHCNLDTMSKDDNYAPCKLNSLLKKNINYWALGHIHKRAIVYENPYIVYPGNTQGRNPKESGEKGAFLVSVMDGVVQYTKFFRTGPILWDNIEVDITDKTTVNQVVDYIVQNAEAGSLLRIRLVGHGVLDSMIRLDQDAFKEVIQAGTSCLVTSLDIDSTPEIDMEKREETGDFISAIINYGNKINAMSRKELLDIICFSITAQSISNKFETFTDDELRNIVRDATYMVVEKMLGAQK